MSEQVVECRAFCQTMPRPPDPCQETIEAFLAGDEQAFDILFQRYYGYVFNICLGITASKDDAEDAAQETLLKAYRSLRSFRRSAQFSTWLYRIAVNCAIESVRQSSRTVAASDLMENGPPSDTQEVVDSVVRALDRDRVHQALSHLPLSYRVVLTLRYLQDLSLEEIAQVQRCRVGCVKVRLHRARLAFRDAYMALENRDELALSADR